MSVVTRTGDGGTTRTLDGRIVRKDNPIIEFFGTVDELTSFLGLAKVHLDGESKDVVERIQNILFKVNARVGNPEKYPDVTDEISWIENVIESLEGKTEIKGFVIPGSSETTALLDMCRTIARRAERRISTLLRRDPRLLNAQIFLNRLSDMLFLLARSLERSD